MAAWFAANGGTLLITLALVVIIALVIFKLYKDKKKGASSCGCGCEHCAMRDKCHTPTQKQ